MTEANVRKVLSIALRGADRGPMTEVRRTRARAGGGLEGDVPASPERGVTFLAAAQWEEVGRALEAALPWHTRRANLLVDGGSLASWIGKEVTVGEAVVRIEAETVPCGLMDKIHAGLREALGPQCRGGVYGRVTSSGTIRVGDEVAVREP